MESELELFALSAVVIFVAVLILNRPFAEAHHQNPERFLLRPETVFHTGVHHELFVGHGLIDFAVNLQERTVVDEVEELCADLMRMEARPATGLYMRQVH